mmetsp:Transcript_16590/g.36117  ORF Transcript_16590/g.36117 Transcript_16590/m.36117 type:complete len:264 (+) Transcript_16590:284-1075(+)
MVRTLLMMMALPLVASFDGLFSRALVLPSSCSSRFVRYGVGALSLRSGSTSTQAAASNKESLVTLEDGLHEDEQTIKKSRFIGLATNCASWDDAQTFIASVRADHPKARHVCFGFVAGVNPVQERASDDGEPTGTGGAPIIGAIKGESLSDVVCAVVRYSGGIKLGAGGLIRAYGGTARLALRVGPNKVLIPMSTIRVSTAASNAGCIYQSIQKHGGTASGEEYNDKGDIGVTLVVETQFLNQLKADINDATKGNAVFLSEEG